MKHTLALAGLMALGVAGAAAAQEGDYCREYTTTLQVDGRTQRAYGTACMEPDGSWRLQRPDSVSDQVVMSSPPPPGMMVLDDDDDYDGPYIMRREYSSSGPGYVMPYGPEFSFSYGHNDRRDWHGDWSGDWHDGHRWGHWERHEWHRH